MLGRCQPQTLEEEQRGRLVCQRGSGMGASSRSSRLHPGMGRGMRFVEQSQLPSITPAQRPLGRPLGGARTGLGLRVVEPPGVAVGGWSQLGLTQAGGPTARLGPCHTLLSTALRSSPCPLLPTYLFPCVFMRAAAVLFVSKVKVSLMYPHPKTSQDHVTGLNQGVLALDFGFIIIR